MFYDNIEGEIFEIFRIFKTKPEAEVLKTMMCFEHLEIQYNYTFLTYPYKFFLPLNGKTS